MNIENSGVERWDVDERNERPVRDALALETLQEIQSRSRRAGLSYIDSWTV